MAVQIAHMYEYADVPLIAKPNAGLPELVDGQTVYNLSPEEFAAGGKLLVEAGVILSAAAADLRRLICAA